MRQFIKLSYLGTQFHGWQYQPNAITVQEKIEAALSTYLKKKTSIVGCGRTDTGVHAREYYAHFDADHRLDLKALIRSTNAMAGPDIVIEDIYEVAPGYHARFDAVSRTYEYLLSTAKNPFSQGLVYTHFSSHKIDTAGLQQVADLLLKYQEFLPFTKTNSDTPHYKCDVTKAIWQQDSVSDYKFTITSNRFLRGMVRLIVGMCLHVAEGKVALKDVQYAMDHQSPIVKSWSVPAEGLYLSEVKYL